MKRSGVWFIMLCGMVALPMTGFAEEPVTGVKISGSGGLEIGQIRNGSYQSNQNELQMIKKGWQERFLYRLKYEMNPTERVRIFMDVEGQISFSYPQMLNPIESQSVRYLFSPEHLDGTYSLGGHEKPWLEFGVGYFPYKFNPDAKNLGEIPFRSGTYPVYIITNFDHCYGKLFGFRLSSTLFDDLKQDIMFTSEALMFPTQDYGLTYAVRYSLTHVVDLGASFTMAHLFSIEEKLTKGSLGDLRITENGDTVPYSFEGKKPAACIAFDPRPLLPEAITHLMGGKDGRIYGEVCVTGWENRKTYDSTVLNDTTRKMNQYYANRADRTIFMFGMNIPTFKAFDVLSLEFEHFPNRYPNSYRKVLEENLATPMLPLYKTQLAWRWSLYGKRSIGNHFSIVGQIARDHMRTTFPDLKLSEKEDILKYGKDWWWNVAFNFSM